MISHWLLDNEQGEADLEEELNEYYCTVSEEHQVNGSIVGEAVPHLCE